MNLEEVWRHLEKDSRITAAPGRVQRRILPAGRRNLLLGLEIPSRNRMLILRVSAGSVEGLPDVPDSRGLTVRFVRREDGNDGAEVVLALRDWEHRDIFDLLVTDLVDAAEQFQDEGRGLTRFIARLSAWQQLFHRLGVRGLSRDAQQGLWGELWVLRDVIAPLTGMNRALDGWRGPMGADQDFQMGSTCIEVKTSTSATLDRLAISGERQLDVPKDVVLLLLGLSLDRRVRHGETLPDMVGSVRAAASHSGSLHLIDHRLDLSGYVGDDAKLYSDIGYTVLGLHPFRVEEGFPRIVPGDLQTGVSDVRYLISVSSCTAFRMQGERPEQLLEGLL